MIAIHKNAIRYLYIDILKHKVKVEIIDNKLSIRLHHHDISWVYTASGWKPVFEII